MTLEGGKPLIENSDEVGWTAAAFDYYAEMGATARPGHPVHRVDAARTRGEGAVGVWAAIVPWNYPLLLLAWKRLRRWRRATPRSASRRS